MKVRTARRRLFAGLFLLLQCAIPSVARSDANVAPGVAAPVGPAIGNVRYRGAIAAPAGDVVDDDVFTGRFLAGDVLSVAVTARRTGRGAPPLQPEIELVDPLGLVRAPLLRAGSDGATLAFRDQRIDRAGTWTLRVRGVMRTAGPYDIAFRVRSARRTTLEGNLGGDRSLEATHTFSAFEGATLDARLLPARRGAVVAFAGLRSPTGAEILAPAEGAGSSPARRAELRKVVLAPGTGEYALRVRAAEATSYRLALAVNAPKRPSGGRLVVLTSDEPSLVAFDAPLVATAGSTVRFPGAHFVARGRTSVLFGATKSPSVRVVDGGAAVEAVVPPRSGPAVVSITVVNPDGQACSRDAHFAYVPAPSVADIVDAGTGRSFRATSSTAGRAVRLLGENLEPGQTVRVGGAAVPAVAQQGGREIRFTLPIGLLGEQAVTVTDAWGRGDAGIRVEFKHPPAFAARPFTPTVVAVGDRPIVTVRGAMFEAQDRWFLGGAEIETEFVDVSTRTFRMPPVPENRYRLRIVDRVGAIVDGPEIPVKGAPEIASVSVAGGAAVAGPTVPACGGTAVRLDGAKFHEDDVITVGGDVADVVLQRSESAVVFVAPPRPVGPAEITVRDAAGQTGSLAAGIRYARLRDVSSALVPASEEDDEITALRGAVGDLDGDGRADDAVLLSESGSPRLRRARVLLGGADGALADASGQVLPVEEEIVETTVGFDGACVAIGDFDGQNGADVAMGGTVADGADLPLVHFLVARGDGRFAFDSTLLVPAHWGEPEVNARFGNSWYRVCEAAPQRGSPQAMAFGDVDGDGDLDLVVGTDVAMQQRFAYDPAYLDRSQSPPRLTQVVPVSWSRFRPGTRLFDNRVRSVSGFVDVSDTRLPPVGTTLDTENPAPALVCRDLALADVDTDGDLDLVVAWDDPAGVSTAGFASRDAGGAGAVPRIATRILLNSGGALTTDATDAWMPMPSGAERWQANRIALADLDSDGDADLVLAVKRGLDAWTGAETHARRALRVLRNDGSSFTDVTASALPAVSGDDDLRADALVATDVDGDGRLDLVLATAAPLRTASGAAAPRTRVLFGQEGLRFVAGAPFSEDPSTDSGEATDVLVLGALSGRTSPVFLLLGESRPAASPATRRFVRAQEWWR